MQLSHQMKLIQDKITELSVNMNAQPSAFTPIIAIQGTTGSVNMSDSSKQTDNVKPQRKTYAAAIFTDLAKVVNTVVSDSIKTQRLSER